MLENSASSDATFPTSEKLESEHGSLAHLLSPRSVAIVGASDGNSMSQCVHNNLLRHDFPGKVYLVNPNRHTVHNMPAVRTLGSIGQPVDLVFSLLNATRVPDMMDEAASCGIRNLVVLSGGFAEEGSRGAEAQRLLVAAARRHRQLVLGPNTIGFLNLHERTVLYGSPLVPPAYPDVRVEAGTVGVVVQSGIVAHTLIRGLLGRGAGISTVVALGNEATVGIHHIIEHLAKDRVTKVIALFIETIRDRPAFEMACLLAASAGKPIVALKGGRSTLGAATAKSHTGALAGNAAIYAAAFRRLGIIPAQSMEELVVTAAHLAHHGPAAGKRVAFVALSGGFCEIFADRAEEVGLEMPPLSAGTVEKLRAILPPGATLSNPLDTTGVAQTDATLMPRAMEALAQDDAFDAVFVGRNVWRATPQDAEPIIARFRTWGDVIRNSPIPILPVSDLLVDTVPFERTFSEATGIPPEIGGVTHGLQAFARGAEWRRGLRHVWSYNTSVREAVASTDCLSVPRRPLSEYEVLTLLAEADCPVVPWELARTRDKAVEAADALGYPVAVKVSSRVLPHKSASGGVILDVTDAVQVERAWDSIMSSVQRVVSAEQLDGVLVTPMRPRALELIVGIRRDVVWGLTLVLGFGGVWAELLRDVAILPLPVGQAEVLEMLSSLRGARLLHGGHGTAAANVDAIAEAVVNVARLAAQLGDTLDSLEVNPLRVDGACVEALDGLIVWKSGTYEDS